MFNKFGAIAAMATAGIIAAQSASAVSVIGTGTELALRDGPNFGRTNTTAGGTYFLDSNDTLGMEINLNVGALFDSILFTLTDPADAGAQVSLIVDGVSHAILSGLSNATAKLIEIDLGTAVTSAVLKIENSRLNDGFGLDDLTVGDTGTGIVPAVPLPPGAVLLGGGLLALAAYGRRARRSAGNA